MLAIDPQIANLLLRALEEHPRGASPYQLRKDTDLSLHTIRTSLRCLRKEGRVEFIGGRYRLPKAVVQKKAKPSDSLPASGLTDFDAIRRILRLHAQAAQARGESQLEFEQGDDFLNYEVRHPLKLDRACGVHNRSPSSGALPKRSRPCGSGFPLRAVVLGPQESPRHFQGMAPCFSMRPAHRKKLRVSQFGTRERGSGQPRLGRPRRTGCRADLRYAGLSRAR